MNPASPHDKEHPLSSVLGTALDAVIVMTADGRVSGWNDVAVETFGWARHEAVGTPLCDLIIPPHLRDAHRAGLSTFLKTGAGPLLNKRIEVKALHKSGNEIPVELLISPYSDHNSISFLGFVRDITERKQAAERLEKQALRATTLYEIISYCADATSFDEALRTTLRAVQQLTGWPAGHVYLPSDTNPPRMIPTNIWYPAEDERFQALREATAKITFAIGEGLPGHIMQTGEPLWIPDVFADARFVRARDAHNLGITSAMGFPIQHAGSIEAVVEFFTDVQTPPDHDLLLTLRSMGVQVGRVLERIRSQEQLRQQSEHQKLLLAELNHRVHNMLAVVTGIAAHTVRNSKTLAEFNRSFLERLTALSKTHGLLAAQNWEPTSFHELAELVLQPYQGTPAQVSIDGPAFRVSPKASVAVGMVLHELATNAAKYGALAHPDGSLVLRWRLEQDPQPFLRIFWCERGVQNVEKPAKRGFGTRLIDMTVKNELCGNLSVNYAEGGLQYRIELPMGQLQASNTRVLPGVS
jgi:PAS domain S-box-containing protein